MKNVNAKATGVVLDPVVPAETLESTLEELSVAELEERLEFVAWCDHYGR